MDAVKVLISNGADVNHKTCKGAGHSPLTLATNFGHLDVVKLLLLNGGNKDHKTDSGDTALIIAATRGYEEIMKILLSIGCDKSVKNNLGLSAEDTIHISQNERHQKILNEYDKTGTNEEKLLVKAISESNLDSVTLLLARGAMIDTQDEEQNTILHIASEKGNENVVKMLLNLGADRSMY